MPANADTLSSLQKYFGFTDFREGQREVIDNVLEGKDVLVVMPTGSGKSLCYQLPAMMLGGATLIVSPLIALMKDQVDALRARGLPATFINSSLALAEQRTRIDDLRRGHYKLVYVAPERFRSSRFVEAITSLRISLFAVDEAHCVSTWGHDFRPDYLRLKNVIKSLNGAHTLALTATATPYVRSDIIEQLGLKAPQTFVSGFDRPNLTISVVHTETEREKIARISRLATTHEGSGIVYTATRKAVESVTAKLHSQGLAVVGYHAGMPDSNRAKAQDGFMSGRAQMIVATNAFGMGIDKPDIRFVAHYQMPGSIEAYYQEIGRAGRDGLSSSCVLLFNYVDKNTHDFFIEGSYPSAEIIRNVYDSLRATGQTRIELSTSEIARRADVSNEMAVQSSLYLLERAGHIERTAPSDPTRRLRAIVMLDNVELKQLRVNFNEVGRRAALERRKLREMIEFCYSEDCYRAHILNYFGDRHHTGHCGTCGNCKPRSQETIPAGEIEDHPRSAARSTKSSAAMPSVAIPRALNSDETQTVRKILACATRMKGRFGKTVLAGVLRGSAAKNVMRTHLNELSTYGILRQMRQEDIMQYIDALIAAQCLRTSVGQYPTVAITELGQRVMREQEQVMLALPTGSETVLKESSNESEVLPQTAVRTYQLYCSKVSVSEIAAKRNLTTATIENHLVECVRAGFPLDISQFVSAIDRVQIDAAISKHGMEKLKPIHDDLPETITYNMIRFVIADRERLQTTADTTSLETRWKTNNA